MAKDKRNEANCNECVHGCVCQFKDEVMEALTKEKERPIRCFGGIGNHVASMEKSFGSSVIIIIIIILCW